jgi:hypothetical protein
LFHPSPYESDITTSMSTHVSNVGVLVGATVIVGNGGDGIGVGASVGCQAAKDRNICGIKEKKKKCTCEEEGWKDRIVFICFRLTFGDVTVKVGYGGVQKESAPPKATPPTSQLTSLGCDPIPPPHA